MVTGTAVAVFPSPPPPPRYLCTRLHKKKKNCYIPLQHFFPRLVDLHRVLPPRAFAPYETEQDTEKENSLVFQKEKHRFVVPVVIPGIIHQP